MSETASGVGIPPCTALRACRVPCQEQESPPVPLIVLPKSCLCRCGPCPPYLSLVWGVCFLSFWHRDVRFIYLFFSSCSPIYGLCHVAVSVWVSTTLCLCIYGNRNFIDFYFFTPPQHGARCQRRAAGRLAAGRPAWERNLSSKHGARRCNGCCFLKLILR